LFLITAGIHTVAGAVSGAINSAITGSDIGMGMLTGAVGAGIGSVTGGALTLLNVDQFGYQLVARTVTGGVAGGVVSEIYGGNFWQGFAQGAATAAAAFLFNHCFHENGEPDLRCDEYGPDEDLDGTYGLRLMLEQNDRNMEGFAKAGEAMQKGAEIGGKALVVFYVGRGLYQIQGVGAVLRFFWRLAASETQLRSDTPQEKK